MSPLSYQLLQVYYEKAYVHKVHLLKFENITSQSGFLLGMLLLSKNKHDINNTSVIVDKINL